MDHSMKLFIIVLYLAFLASGAAACAEPIALTDPVILHANDRRAEWRLAFIAEAEQLSQAGRGVPDFYRIVLWGPEERASTAPILRVLPDPAYSYIANQPREITRAVGMAVDENGSYLLVVVSSAINYSSVVSCYVFGVSEDEDGRMKLDDVAEPRGRRLGDGKPDTVSFRIPLREAGKVRLPFDYLTPRTHHLRLPTD